MAIDGYGICDGDRPSQPSTGNYVAPRIVARDLIHRGKYAADTTPIGIGLPLALHHIVPWEHLWAFWNAMIEAEFYGAARDFLAILGVPKALSDKPINDMKKGTYLNASYYYDVLICWSEWNLVRGPQFRTDASKPEGDPGAALDDMHWGAGKESKRIKNIAELDVVITTYTARMQNEKQLCREIRSWSELARNSLVEFIPGMWTIETKSEDYVPGGHANAIHPRWNKKIRD